MNLKHSSKSIPIAIIGVGCIFPKAENFTQYWSNIKNQVDAIVDVPETHWNIKDYYDKNPKAGDRTYGFRGGFIPAVDFNPMEFGIAPNTLEAIDTAQLLGLLVAKKTLEDAGYGLNKKFNRERASVILGVTGSLKLIIPLGARLGFTIWKRAMKEAGITENLTEKAVQKISESYVDWQEDSFPGLLGNVVAGRIANHMNFGGTNCVVDSACGSSLSALNLASLELAAGHSDMVLTGGVDTFNDIFMYMCFSKTPALSPTGDAKPFSSKADGTVIGEGLGMFLLKRLSDAERDGDKIYAVIRSIGTSSDGKGKAIFAPDAEGQVRAILQAYNLADINPRTIELMEAHGTGTKVGDYTEITALHKVYKPLGDEKAWCALGSVKSQIGHTKAAAGAAGLIKATMALYNKILPPTVKVEQPMEELEDGKTPFYLNTEKRPWVPKDSHPRRAAVSSFGFGGSNFHCVLEEYENKKPEIDWDDDIEILSFSAEKKENLKEKLIAFEDIIKWNSEFQVKAHETRKSFNIGHPYRLILVLEKGNQVLSTSLADAIKMFDKFPEKKCWHTPTGAYFGSGKPDGLLGILFPGQGSQYVGMLRDIACQFPQMHNVLSIANNLFQKYKAFEITKRLIDYIYPPFAFDDEIKKLNENLLKDTRVAQSALGVVTLGTLKVLQYFGITPGAFAGHSYGELAALCAGGCITEEDLYYLSALRGNLMSEQAGKDKGGMLAVHADISTVSKLISNNSLDLVIANKNAPNQVVLSGKNEEIEKAVKILENNKIQNTKLQVYAAFHSPIVSDAKKKFALELEKIKFSVSKIPVFSNTTGEKYPDSIEKTRTLIAGQLSKPVEFVDEITSMFKFGVRTFLEVGPKTTLSGLVKAILGKSSDYEAISLDTSIGKRNGIFDLAKTLANLAVIGYDVKLSLWNPKIGDEKIISKPKMTIPICGANYRSNKRMEKETKTMSITTLNNEKEHENFSVNLPENKLPHEIKLNFSDKEESLKTQFSEAVKDSPGMDEESKSTIKAALQITQKNMEDLQKMQEQTSRLHKQFLENQEMALNTYQALVEQQQQLFRKSLGFPQQAGKTADLIKLQETAVIIPANEPLIHIEKEPSFLPEIEAQFTAPALIENMKSVAAQEKQLKTSSFEQISKVLIELVSDKTGYPPEMLELDMNLNTDLGIDSIKRVEILSALKDRVPEAHLIKSEHMGSLKTLKNIAQFIANSDSKQEGDIKTSHEVNIDTLKESDSKTNIDVSEMESLESHIERMVVSIQEIEETEKKTKISITSGSEIWITEDNSGIAEKIEEILGSMNYRPKIISLDNLSEIENPSSLGGLLIISPPGKVEDNFLKNSFKLVKMASSGLREAGRMGGSFFITISRLGGQFGLDNYNSALDPLSGGLAGLSKTANHEWPNVNCRALDLALDFTDLPIVASKIVNEMFFKGPIETGIFRQGCFEIKLRLSGLKNTDPENFPIGSGDVLVITGGARGVTAQCAIKIANDLPQHKKPVIVLLGRSPEPETEPQWLESLTNEVEIKRAILESSPSKKLSPKEISEQYLRIIAGREISATISRIKSAGVKVVYYSVDVRKVNDIIAVLNEVRTNLGPIKGIIHGAGVISDHLIEDKSAEEFDYVYNTKVGGLQTLLKATQKDDLKIIILFSSSTARYGRKGQADYAVANEVLNKMAQHQAVVRRDCRVVSINWGPWDGGMVNQNLKGIFKEEGIDLIPIKVGSTYLLNEMCSDSERNVEVVVLANSNGQREIVKDKKGISLSVSFERKIDVESYPFLKSHILDGRAVMPMAVIIELLINGALHQNPGLNFYGFNNLQILNGIKIERDESLTIRVLAGRAVKEENLFVIPVSLGSLKNSGALIPNASAEIVLSTERSKGIKPAIKLSLPPGQKMKNYYENYLFHGSDLWGIEQIYGFNEEGISGLVKTAPKPASWIKHPLRNSWFTDPLAIDSSFQMMIIWTFEKYGAFSLPTFAGNYRQFKEFPKDNVKVNIKITGHTENIARADIEYIDQKDTLIAKMENYECIIDHMLENAFKNNCLLITARS